VILAAAGKAAAAKVDAAERAWTAWFPHLCAMRGIELQMRSEIESGLPRRKVWTAGALEELAHRGAASVVVMLVHQQRAPRNVSRLADVFMYLELVLAAGHRVFLGDAMAAPRRPRALPPRPDGAEPGKAARETLRRVVAAAGVVDHAVDDVVEAVIDQILARDAATYDLDSGRIYGWLRAKGWRSWALWPAGPEFDDPDEDDGAGGDPGEDNTSGTKDRDGSQGEDDEHGGACGFWGDLFGLDDLEHLERGERGRADVEAAPLSYLFFERVVLGRRWALLVPAYSGFVVTATRSDGISLPECSAAWPALAGKFAKIGKVSGALRACSSVGAGSLTHGELAEVGRALCATSNECLADEDTEKVRAALDGGTKGELEDAIRAALDAFLQAQRLCGAFTKQLSRFWASEVVPAFVDVYGDDLEDAREALRQGAWPEVPLALAMFDSRSALDAVPGVVKSRIRLSRGDVDPLLPEASRQRCAAIQALYATLRWCDRHLDRDLARVLGPWIRAEVLSKGPGTRFDASASVGRLAAEVSRVSGYELPPAVWWRAQLGGRCGGVRRHLNEMFPETDFAPDQGGQDDDDEALASRWWPAFDRVVAHVVGCSDEVRNAGLERSRILLREQVRRRIFRTED
jgi:hypothetical protein